MGFAAFGPPYSEAFSLELHASAATTSWRPPARRVHCGRNGTGAVATVGNGLPPDPACWTLRDARTPLAVASDIFMSNPYQSPSSPCSVSPKHGQVCAFVLAVVLLNVAWNARNVVRNWSELTLVHHFLGVLLWLALPLLAVLLLWRGRAVGRWVLVGLFGVRSLGGLLLTLSPIYSVVIRRHPGLLLQEPCRTWVFDTLFYFSATVWLLTSPSVRQVCGGFHRRTRTEDTANVPHPQGKSPPGGATRGPVVD